MKVKNKPYKKNLKANNTYFQMCLLSFNKLFDTHWLSDESLGTSKTCLFPI